MNKKAQYGFAHLALVLLLLIAVIVGFTGYKVVKNRQQSSKATQTSTTITKTDPNIINSKADLDKAANMLKSQNVDGDLNPDSLNSDVNSLL